MSRFFVYEEYGAKYEIMIKDVASTYRTIPQWELYQRGFEALASSLASIDCQIDTSKKALTIGDLLVKVSILMPVIDPYNPDKGSAHTARMQVSTAVCRALEADSSLRLPRVPYPN